MGKGRKPIPSKIVQLTGGVLRTHRPPRDQEPPPREKMPACPEHLDEAARKEWKRAGKILQDVGLMTDLDMAVFAGYCDAYSQWAKATVEVPKKGPVWIDKEGVPRLNPWLRVVRETYDRMMKAAVLLGLSPSSRASLKVEKSKPKSKAQRFADRKGGLTK